MLTKEPNDTITAQSTPSGYSGVGIIRISGPDALSIASKLFITKNGAFPERQAVYGRFKNPESGAILDDGLCLVMRGPDSYTGEDIVELNLHGSPVILNAAIKLIISEGARSAKKGEFTRRAFLAGKMDLLQAEAVVDIIEATSLTAVGAARAALDSELSAEILNISGHIKDILATLEAHIDFDDDDLEEPPDLAPSIAAVISSVDDLLSRTESSRIRRSGVRVVAAGKPNVGKSTLFNALLKMDRMIVTPYPGTTRDTVDESVIIDDRVFILSDTAGIRNDPDPIEMEGIIRSRKKIEQADLVLVTLDGNSDLQEEDYKALNISSIKPRIIVINKSDLGLLIDTDEIRKHAPEVEVLTISAKTGAGMGMLEKSLIDAADKLEGPELRAGLNERCALLMSSVSDYLHRAQTGVAEAPPGWPEIVFLELRSSLDKIGEVTGEFSDEGILERIFDKFCVGK